MTDAANARQNSIGALRLILAAMVVYSHAYYLGRFGPEPLLQWTDGRMFCGMLAVQGFFCISGYLVTRSFLERPHVGRYLWHRTLRLAPAFWACLLVTAFLFSPLSNFLSPAELRWQDMVGYVSNNLYAPRAQISVGMHPRTWNTDWNGSLWTLGYEFACYLMIAVAGVAGLLSRFRWIFAAAVAAAGAIYFVRQGLGVGPGGLLLDRLFDTPGKILTWHFLVASAFAAFPAAVAAARQSRSVGIVAMLLVVVSWHGPVWLSPLAMPPAILWISHWLPIYRFESTVGGDYSYGLYLYGYPVQELLLSSGMERFGIWIFFLLSMILALACGIASWHGVEKMVLRLR